MPNQRRISLTPYGGLPYGQEFELRLCYILVGLLWIVANKILNLEYVSHHTNAMYAILILFLIYDKLRWILLSTPRNPLHRLAEWTVSPQQSERFNMMTSSNGNIFCVTGHLCGEFTGHRGIPRTMAIFAELWCFFDLHPNKRLSKQSWGWWFEMPSSHVDVTVMEGMI